MRTDPMIMIRKANRMEKKTYEKPTMKVVKLQHQTQLLQASQQSQSTGVQDYNWNNVDEE